MKKIGPLMVVFIFAAFQTFQFWDESQDAAEALSDNCRQISQKHSAYAAATSDDDPDASLPLVVGQSLSHQRVASRKDLTLYRPVPSLAVPAVAIVATASVQDRAPPSACSPDRNSVPTALLVVRSCARSLAPPMA